MGADTEMTMKDYFAAKAMQVIYMEAVAKDMAGNEAALEFGIVAKDAYRMAGAMMEARENASV